MSAPTLQPWYRHRWPWLLMLGPAAAVLGGVATLWLALLSDDGLVASDYYKQGLAINRTLSREQLARTREYRAQVEIFAESGGVRVRLSSAQGAQLPAALQLRLAHPTRAAGDQSVALQRDAHGAYAGVLRLSTPGRRTLIVEDAAQSWRLVGAIDTARAQSVELRAQ